MKTLKTAIVGTAAATAMAVSATPAMAKDGHHKNGISAGEVIAGAVVLGGIAAILTSGKKDKYAYNDHRGYRGDYNRGHYKRGNYRHGRFGPRKATNQCVQSAERRATRNFGWADVTEIRDVKRTRYGWKVKGRIVVQDTHYRGRKGRYYNSGYRNNYDKGKFTCYIERGNRAQIDFKNLDRGRRW